MLVARDEPAVVVRPAAVRRSFVRGFAVQAANPKALVFFVALLPQFVSRESPVGAQLLVLGVTSLAIELFVLGCYLLVTLRARRMAGARLAGPLERIGGGLLVAAGARLALVR
jgi:threonine/homoserine/homoserine lactone efflux protein